MNSISKNKVIVVDIDDVLLEFTKSLNNFYNKRYETNFSFEDYCVYNFSKIWNVSETEATKRVFDFFDSEDFRKIEPLEGSTDAIKELFNQSYFLINATSRHAMLREKTKESIEKYFQGMFSKLHTNKYFTKPGLFLLDKSKICHENDASFIVEDNLETAIRCAEKGIEVILFDKPWNQSFKEENKIKRVGKNKNHWKEALEYILNQT